MSPRSDFLQNPDSTLYAASQQSAHRALDVVGCSGPLQTLFHLLSCTLLELVNHESERPRIWYYLKCDEETLCAFMVQKDLTSSDMELFALQKTQNTLHE